MALKRNILFGLISLLVLSCSGNEHFSSLSQTQFFLVDYNPSYLDVLWVVDDRSSLYSARDHLISESKRFFQRLDAITASYQMGIITSDMLTAKGRLQPLSNPITLKRNYGTVEERTNLFGSTMTQVLVNLGTDAESKGLLAAETALKSSFVPRSGVPLVLVFISDADDHSVDPSVDAVAQFSASFLALKGGNTSLVRPYAINYVKLEASDDPAVKRCATRYQADIDSTKKNPDGTAYFKDTYFKLADKLGGDTADLCSNFSEKIDLSGLTLKSLPNRFALEKRAVASSITVDVFRGTEHHPELKWKYQEDTNEIVFESTPPQGVTVQVTYQSY